MVIAAGLRTASPNWDSDPGTAHTVLRPCAKDPPVLVTLAHAPVGNRNQRSISCISSGSPAHPSHCPLSSASIKHLGETTASGIKRVSGPTCDRPFWLRSSASVFRFRRLALDSPFAPAPVCRHQTPSDPVAIKGSRRQPIHLVSAFSFSNTPFLRHTQTSPSLEPGRLELSVLRTSPASLLPKGA
jgi:hypothetical protein